MFTKNTRSKEQTNKYTQPFAQKSKTQDEISQTAFVNGKKNPLFSQWVS
jgi:hypothetical protein